MTLSYKNLLIPFQKGCKTTSDFRLGAEFEFFVVDEHFHLIPYCCDGGVEETLRHMSKSCLWEESLEGTRLVGLQRDGQAVTIEPSGTIEFSTSPVKDLQEAEAQRNLFLKQLARAADEFGHQLLMIGVLPYDSVEDVSLVPKARYQFMYEYMPRVGTRGREMMKLSSAVQASFDYESESDAMRKFKVASLCTPAFLALSANSSIQHGRFQESASIRGQIWQDTDNQRSGIPPFVFNSSCTFQDYVDWALDIPMYFAQRNGNLYAKANPTFREFLNGSSLPDDEMPSPEATEQDWELHLSTLFPWVRLKNFIEVRAFDMCCPRMQMALIALVKGIFYSPSALEATEALVGGYDQATMELLIEQASLRGLDGRANETSLRELSKNLLDIAREGLNEQDPTEASYLDPLYIRIEDWRYEGIKESISSLGIPNYLKQFVPQNKMLTQVSEADMHLSGNCNAG